MTFEQWYENRYGDSCIKDFVDAWIYQPCKASWEAAVNNEDESSGCDHEWVNVPALECEECGLLIKD